MKIPEERRFNLKDAFVAAMKQIDNEGVRPLSRWANNKTGNIYLAIGYVTNATNEQDGQRMMLYCSQKDGEQPMLFVRKDSEFFQKFTLKE